MRFAGLVHFLCCILASIIVGTIFAIIAVQIAGTPREKTLNIFGAFIVGFFIVIFIIMYILMILGSVGLGLIIGGIVKLFDIWLFDGASSDFWSVFGWVAIINGILMTIITFFLDSDDLEDFLWWFKTDRGIKNNSSNTSIKNNSFNTSTTSCSNCGFYSDEEILGDWCGLHKKSVGSSAIMKCEFWISMTSEQKATREPYSP